MQLAGYHIESTLGDGGMATVYKGTQLSLQRPVAIKVLKHKLLEQPEIRRHFERESIIIARLNHPNIIHVIDQGILSDGRPYFVMEYVKSIGLHTAMDKGKLTTNRALDIFTQIAKALAYAHKNGVIHCDIKPENILVDFEGFVRVLDFGIAQILEDTTGSGELNFVMGTENYMSPEQHRSMTEATEKSDLYALGVLMYRYFTSQFPKEGATSARQLNHDLSPELDQLISQCLAPLPANRPENAESVKNRLLRALQGKHLNPQQQQRANAGVEKSFHLLDVIKEDKHGAVYLFEEENNGTLFIIKKKKQGNPGYASAKRLAQINHDHIVKIFGASQNERAFILVMEYCRGGALSDRLAAPFDIDNFLIIAKQLVDGLLTAHNAGITHGNLRPSNILFDENNRAKITDFCLDEHYSEENANWYALSGQDQSNAGDVFSMGAIFYQMLTGNIPKWKAHKLQKTKSFARLPTEVQTLLRQMLAAPDSPSAPHLGSIANTLNQLLDNSKTIARTRQPSLAQRRHAPTTTPDMLKPGQAVKIAILTATICLAIATQAFLIYSDGIHALISRLQGWLL